jgi:hypothetical protein
VDPAPERPRSRTRTLVLAIVLVLAIAAAAFLLLGGDDDPDPAAAPAPTQATDTTATTTAPTPSSVPSEPPAAPSNLAVTPESPTALSMTWIDNAEDEARYLVARVRSDVADEIADLPANSAGYVVDGLEPNTLYCLTVAATNAAVTEPEYLEPVCAVTAP